jgi:unsaturated chondroitin disaccharide hydrolase
MLASTSDFELFANAMDFAARQLRTLMERYPDFYPMYTEGGRWKHSGEAWTHWCDGFLPGMLWIVCAQQGAGAEGNWWREQAIRYSRPLEPRKLDRAVHDLGFVFMSSYYRWYGLTGDPVLRAVLVEAGRTLSLRFREKGRYLRSFLAPASLFIDIMANVGLILYAAVVSGDREMMEIARQHCYTTRRVLVRGDGSTAHEGLFDLETGEFLRQSTQQGYRGDSCWSRGLAWALYGFGTAFSYTQDPLLLATAEACADFYLLQTPVDGVPPWDYDAPPESRQLADTSAAAIAASGLMQLSGLTRGNKGRGYGEASRRILTTLCREWLAVGDPGWEGILKGGVYHLHKKLGVNESVMWGEYFFLEALERVLSRDAGSEQRPV